MNAKKQKYIPRIEISVCTFEKLKNTSLETISKEEKEKKWRESKGVHADHMEWHAGLVVGLDFEVAQECGRRAHNGKLVRF